MKGEIRRSLLKFFVLTYLVSWTFFAASKYVSNTSSLSALAGFRGSILIVGVFAPSLVSLALTARAEGSAGMLALLRRIIELPAGARWYVFAISYMAVIKLTAALLHRLITGGWPAFGQESVFLMLGAVVLSTPVQAGEEIGWRGYALPRLANRIGLGPASIVLGLIWACWHLPFFLFPGADKFGQSFPVYLLQVTALSVAMAWLYWRTNGSLFITMLLHASVNNTKDIVPSAVSGATNPFAPSTSLVAWLTVALMWIPAIFFFVRMRGVKLVASETDSA